ncbi:hypothetical protein B0H11DRAFT_2293596 [Mycena galericulata]|nr:hypothetical protein B0H11DRAFT_2293596 [Mycena galericulata]
MACRTLRALPFRPRPRSLCRPFPLLLPPRICYPLRIRLFLSPSRDRPGWRGGGGSALALCACCPECAVPLGREGGSVLAGRGACEAAGVCVCA